MSNIFGFAYPSLLALKASWKMEREILYRQTDTTESVDGIHPYFGALIGIGTRRTIHWMLESFRRSRIVPAAQWELKCKYE